MERDVDRGLVQAHVRGGRRLSGVAHVAEQLKQKSLKTGKQPPDDYPDPGGEPDEEDYWGEEEGEWIEEKEEEELEQSEAEDEETCEDKETKIILLWSDNEKL